MLTDQDRVDQSVPDRNHEFSILRDRVEQALLRARSNGADGAQVSASQQAGLDVTVRLGEVETLEYNRDRGISVTVYLGHSKGHANSADFMPESVDRCVDRAMDIARFTEADTCNGVADPALQATDFPDLDLWHPRPLDTQACIDRAMAIEDAGRADAQITNSEGGSVSASHGQSVFGDSNGFMGESCGTRYGQSCVLIAGEGEGMQRDYWYDSQRRFDALEAPETTGAEACRRTIRRLNARKIDTCEAPVLFAPEIATSLLGHFLGAVSGGALYRNASFLKDKVGQKLFPDWLDLLERPLLPRGNASASFDAEGVSTAERSLIDQGVLTGYVLSTYAARRLGLVTTGNAGGIHNLLVGGTLTPAADLLDELGTGLLVTEVMGQGVSLITGDYSRGAAGFWVENGQLAYPVEEVTIAGNLPDMFAGIAAVGDDLDRRGNVQSGSILLSKMMIAGR